MWTFEFFAKWNKYVKKKSIKVSSMGSKASLQTNSTLGGRCKPITTITTTTTPKVNGQKEYSMTKGPSVLEEV